MLHCVKHAALLLTLALVGGFARAVNFSRLPADKGFPQTNISGIAQDKAGDIWVTSIDCGVYRYDGRVIRKIDGGIKPMSLCIDRRGRIFVGTATNIFMYDENRGKTLFSSEEGFRDSAITESGDVFFLSGTRLAVLRAGTDSLRTVFGKNPALLKTVGYFGGGVYFGDAAANLFKVDTASLEVRHLAEFSGEIRCMAGQADNLLWLSDFGHGARCIDVTTGKIIKTLTKKDGLSSDFVQCMCFENDSTLWLGTYEGLNMVNVRDYSVSVSKYHPYDERSLPHNSVKTLFRDFQGGMWAGTFFGGLCYSHKSRNRFNVFREGYGSGFLNDPVVSCISEAPDGTLWIGTNNGGVNVYDKRKGTFSYLRFNTPGDDLRNASNDVKAFCFLPDNRHVYVGFFRGGMKLLDRTSGKIRNLNTPKNVISIKPLDADHLLFNSYNDAGIYCISTDEYRIVEGLKTSYPKFRKSMMIPDVKIASELKDGNGTVWYGTDNGLFKLNSSDSTFVRYTTADGLACNYFNPGAACLGSDGTMYFGGVGGVTWFNPSTFPEEESCPPPVLRSVTAEGDTPLDISRPISLKHSQNMLTFNFSVPDYISVGANDFEYMLTGFEKEWNSSGSKNSAYYPNLPAGVYDFRLRVSRGGAEWVDCPQVPHIRIYRPWYFSVAGVMAEILIIFLAVFQAVRSINRRKEIEHALAMSRMEEKYKRDISKLKALKLVNAQLRVDSMVRPVIEDISRQNELFITKAMSIVEANMSNEEFSTQMLAQKLAISRASLHNRIKEATGQSALDFIRKIRFSEACRLLDEGSLTISEIGYRIGIKDPSYFSSSFKKVVGCSPKDYVVRQNQKN